MAEQWETEWAEVRRNRELDFLMRQLSEIEGWPEGYATRRFMMIVKWGPVEVDRWIGLYRQVQAYYV